jgi:hypothetical protein
MHRFPLVGAVDGGDPTGWLSLSGTQEDWGEIRGDAAGRYLSGHPVHG